MVVTCLQLNSGVRRRNRVLWGSLLRVVIFIAVLISSDACKTMPRAGCEDSRQRPIATAEERGALLNSEPRSFSGLVLDTHSKRPLLGASAYLLDLNVSQVSDSLGIFRFKQLPVGWHHIQLKRLGFEQITDSVFVSKSSGATAVFELSVPRSVRCLTVTTT